MTRLAPTLSMEQSVRDWFEEPEARALIADIAANPPRQVGYLDSVRSILKGGPETVPSFDRNDPRVERLYAMCSAAFLAAEDAGGRLAALAFVKLPRPDALIREAISSLEEEQ